MTASRSLCVGLLPAWVCMTVVMMGTASSMAQPPKDRPGRAKPAATDDPPPRDMRPPLARRLGPGEPEGAPRPWSQVPEPQRRQIEKFIEENFPRMYLELQRLKDDSPRRYERRMTRVAPHMRRIMETLRDDPRLGELMIRERKIEMEIWLTVAAHRQATDDDARQRLRERLRDLAGQAFDCRHERRKLEVEELESRLAMLRTRLSEADTMREALIEHRISEFLEKPLPRDVDADDPPPSEADTQPDE